jgi:hypothetical protein
VYTLATGWIDDMYVGAGPTDPIYGLYGTPTGYEAPGGQNIILGPATGIVLPVPAAGAQFWRLLDSLA